ncbi:hypothetical protein C8R31_11032 [Nitrosospira sp. Nsp2]|nr:hypothetical protein C8R31_11032 [Nitrosospira sp. Nsp2]
MPYKRIKMGEKYVPLNRVLSGSFPGQTYLISSLQYRQIRGRAKKRGKLFLISVSLSPKWLLRLNDYLSGNCIRIGNAGTVMPDMNYGEA